MAYKAHSIEDCKMLKLQTLFIFLLFGGHVDLTPSPSHSCDISGLPVTLTCLFSSDISNKTVFIWEDNDDREVAECKMANRDIKAHCSGTIFQYKSSNSSTLVLESKLLNQNFTGTYRCIVQPEYAHIQSENCTYSEKDYGNETKSRLPATVTGSPTNVTAVVLDNISKNESSPTNVTTIVLGIVVPAIVIAIICVCLYKCRIRRRGYCLQWSKRNMRRGESERVLEDRIEITEEEEKTPMLNTPHNALQSQQMDGTSLPPLQSVIDAPATHNCTVNSSCEALCSRAQNNLGGEDQPVKEIGLRNTVVNDKTHNNRIENVRGSDFAPAQQANKQYSPHQIRKINANSERPGYHGADNTEMPQAGGVKTSGLSATQAALPSGDGADACQPETKVNQPVIAEPDTKTVQIDGASAQVADNLSGDPGIQSKGAYLEAGGDYQHYNNVCQFIAAKDQYLKTPVLVSDRSDIFNWDQTDTVTADNDYSEKYECKTHCHLWMVVEDFVESNTEDNLKLGDNETENSSMLLQIKRFHALAEQYYKHVESKDSERDESCKCKGLFQEKLKEIEQLKEKAGGQLIRLEKNQEALIEARTFVTQQLKATCKEEPYKLDAVDGLTKTCKRDIDTFDRVETKLYTEPEFLQKLQTMSTKCLEWKVLIEKYLKTIRKYQLRPWNNSIEKHIECLEHLKNKVSTTKENLDEVLQNSILYGAFTEADAKVESSKRAMLLNKKKFVNASELVKPECNLHEFTNDVRNVYEDEDQNDDRMLKQKEPLALDNQYPEAKERSMHQLCQDCKQLPGKLSRVPADGYCLLHAVAGAVSLLPSFRDAPETMESAKQKLVTEFDNNRLFYKQYFEKNEQIDGRFDTIEKEFQRYVERGDYNSDTCDHIISFLCNALGVQAKVYFKCPNCNAYNMHNIPPRRVKPDIGCIHLVFSANHYDYIEVNSS